MNGYPYTYKHVTMCFCTYVPPQGPMTFYFFSELANFQVCFNVQQNNKVRQNTHENYKADTNIVVVFQNKDQLKLIYSGIVKVLQKPQEQFNVICYITEYNTFRYFTFLLVKTQNTPKLSIFTSNKGSTSQITVLFVNKQNSNCHYFFHFQ